MKRNVYLSILLFFIGIGAASVFQNGNAEFFGNEYHVQNFGVTGLDKMGLLCEVMWNRGKLFLSLMVLLTTSLKKWIPFCTSACLFLMAGVFIQICVMQFGMKGIVIFLISLFPHGIFYGIVLALLFLTSRNRNYYKSRQTLAKLILMLIIVILFFVGALLEVWTSSTILQKLFLSIS